VVLPEKTGYDVQEKLPEYVVLLSVILTPAVPAAAIDTLRVDAMVQKGGVPK
jgi:hypothetical protein